MPAGVSALTPLANITLGSAANTVTFSSISGLYKDLYLVYRGNADGYSGNAPSMRFNNDSSVAYPCNIWTGDGSGTIAGQSNFSWINISDASYISPAAASMITVHIFDYSSTDKHKTTLSRANAGAAVNMNSGRWPNNAAITSLVLSIGFGSANFVAGSTFALYGISA
jgi:hypothetical protein